MGWPGHQVSSSIYRHASPHAYAQPTQREQRCSWQHVFASCSTQTYQFSILLQPCVCRRFSGCSSTHRQCKSPSLTALLSAQVKCKVSLVTHLQLMNLWEANLLLSKLQTGPVYNTHIWNVIHCKTSTQYPK